MHCAPNASPPLTKVCYYTTPSHLPQELPGQRGNMLQLFLRRALAILQLDGDVAEGVPHLDVPVPRVPARADPLQRVVHLLQRADPREVVPLNGDGPVVRLRPVGIQHSEPDALRHQRREPRRQRGGDGAPRVRLVPSKVPVPDVLIRVVHDDLVAWEQEVEVLLVADGVEHGARGARGADAEALWVDLVWVRAVRRLALVASGAEYEYALVVQRRVDGVVEGRLGRLRWRLDGPEHQYDVGA